MESEKLRRFITYEDCNQFMISIYAIFRSAFLVDVLKTVCLSLVFLSFIIKRKKIEWYFKVRNVEVNVES